MDPSVLSVPRDIRAKTLDAGASAVRAQLPRLGARLPHDRLTCSFRLERPTPDRPPPVSTSPAILSLAGGGAISDRPTRLTLECAKLPSVHHGYEFFYGFPPGHGEEARSVMR
jgi:hypothetical protein